MQGFRFFSFISRIPPFLSFLVSEPFFCKLRVDFYRRRKSDHFYRPAGYWCGIIGLALTD